MWHMLSMWLRHLSTVFFMLGKDIIIIHQKLTAQNQNKNPARRAIFCSKNIFDSKKSNFQKQKQNSEMLFQNSTKLFECITYSLETQLFYSTHYRTTNVKIRVIRHTAKTSPSVLFPLMSSIRYRRSWIVGNLFRSLPSAHYYPNCLPEGWGHVV